MLPEQPINKPWYKSVTITGTVASAVALLFILFPAAKAFFEGAGYTASAVEVVVLNGIALVTTVILFIKRLKQPEQVPIKGTAADPLKELKGGGQ